MARTKSEIRQEIIDSKNSNAVLSNLTSTSATAIWLMWVEIVVIAIWSFELLFDAHKADITQQIESDKSHRLNWYRKKALDFQYGADLVDGEDYFDNAGIDQDTINAQKIIAEAAAVESPAKVLIKVVKEDAGELVPLDSSEYDAIKYYFSRIKDAGIKLEIISQNPDKIKVDLDIYYNPLILDSEGKRIDGLDSKPVQTAIINYLRDLEFDGEFIAEKMIDYIQAVEGVEKLHLNTCLAAKYDNPSFTSVGVSYNPYAGVLQFYDENDIDLKFIHV